MSRVITLAYQIADVFSRYNKIHHEVFKFTIRSLPIPGIHKKVPYEIHEQNLNSVQQELQQIQTAIVQLEEGDLTKRSMQEIHTALREYTSALDETVAKLQVICKSLRFEQEGIADFRAYSVQRYRADMSAYDDCIQQYKRWGKRLNDLFSTF